MATDNVRMAVADTGRADCGDITPVHLQDNLPAHHPDVGEHHGLGEPDGRSGVQRHVDWLPEHNLPKSLFRPRRLC